MKLKTLLLLPMFAWLLALAAPEAALAQTRLLDAPRAAGQVGERFDGYAVVREATAPANVKQLVDQVNADRKSVYEQQARAQGATAGAVGRIYAAQILQAAPAGTWFLQESGQWTQK